MQKILLLFAVLSALCSNAQADSTKLTVPKLHSVSDYLEGVYLTFDDFLAKNASTLPKLERRHISGNQRIHRDSIVNHLFFYNVPAFDKYSDAAVISFNGQLYIRQRDILKYARKGDRNEAGHNPRSYHRVISDGKQLYLEGDFSNQWARGAAAGLGPAGGVWAANMDRRKGLVFDFDSKTFDIFKDCENFVEFLKERKISESVACKQFSIKDVRRIIDNYNK